MTFTCYYCSKDMVMEIPKNVSVVLRICEDCFDNTIWTAPNGTTIRWKDLKRNDAF